MGFSFALYIYRTWGDIISMEASEVTIPEASGMEILFGHGTV